MLGVIAGVQPPTDPIDMLPTAVGVLDLMYQNSIDTATHLDMLRRRAADAAGAQIVREQETPNVVHGRRARVIYSSTDEEPDMQVCLIQEQLA